MTRTYSRVTLPALWTLEAAKLHVKVTGTNSDADLQQKLDTAQEAIVAYLNLSADAAWTAATAPKAVTHAILLLFAYYDQNRGDGNTPNVWPVIHELLDPYRDPLVL